MTLLAVVGPVEGIPGSAYKVGPFCSVPGCGKVTEHAHHILARGPRGKAWDWIRLPDGLVVANKTGLCVEHHGNCHGDGKGGGHKSWIKWIDGVAVWGNVVGNNPALPGFEPVGPLDPQPPTPESLAASQPDAESSESDLCPTCGQHTRRRSSTTSPGERRPRKSWVVRVPADAEDGAAILDAFVDDLAPLLGYEIAASARYFVINAAFVYVEQERSAFIEAIEGIGGYREEEHSHA